ncbi:hypothetical protein TNCV_372651 [Trichonephila clavipes]|nr:hypothetical protein TNCV_372651 [Trichonephila clavipes]
MIPRPSNEWPPHVATVNYLVTVKGKISDHIFTPILQNLSQRERPAFQEGNAPVHTSPDVFEIWLLGYEDEVDTRDRASQSLKTVRVTCPFYRLLLIEGRLELAQRLRAYHPEPIDSIFCKPSVDPRRTQAAILQYDKPQSQ